MTTNTCSSNDDRSVGGAPVDVDPAANLPRTFKYLLATQFLSRGIPFIFNSWIVRHLTEEDYAAEMVCMLLRWLPEDITVHNEDLEGVLTGKYTPQNIPTGPRGNIYTTEFLTEVVILFKELVADSILFTHRVFMYEYISLEHLDSKL